MTAPRHAAKGLKSKHAIRDPLVAEREFLLMLEHVEDSECEIRSDWELLGDACKQLREAHGLTQEQVAARHAFTLADVKALEQQCKSDIARRYFRAVST